MSAENGQLKDTLIVCQTSQGAELQGTLVRFTRHSAIFEIYSPDLVLRTSEVLGNFQIVVHQRPIYSGRAVVRNLVATGLVTLCEVALTDTSWRDVDFTVEMLRGGALRDQFDAFMHEWQKVYKVTAEYKVMIADMETYLTDLRLWLDQVELGIRSSPSDDRALLEQEVAEELAKPVMPCVDALFEKFEVIAQALPEHLVPVHRNYMRRQLHPLILCAPFAYRTFQKPLGYAGDYEMVNMILRNKSEGASLFAKVVNTWFLRQPPAEAHRNRIAYLANMLNNETLRATSQHRMPRMFSVACGPAQEVQRFFSESPLSTVPRFTLLDFNEETLQYARARLAAASNGRHDRTHVEYVRKSVQQIMKESSRTVQQTERQYDCVYCAGLFDYLSDQICRRLMTIMYEWVAPGGLLVATNVESSNPLRNGMEHLLDWHLIYRTASQFLTLAPPQAPPDASFVHCDSTGVNLFLEVRKPLHA